MWAGRWSRLTNNSRQNQKLDTLPSSGTAVLRPYNELLLRSWSFAEESHAWRVWLMVQIGFIFRSHLY